MIEKDNLIFIGKILKTTGLQGSLKIKVLSDFPERFDRLNRVYIYNESKNILIRNKKTQEYFFDIENYNFLSRELKLKFAGFDSIEDSRELTGNFICIEESDKVEIKEGFYYYELIGSDVFSGNEFLGTVLRIENYGGDDLLLLKECSGEKEIFIPLRKEFIKRIDKSGKRIDVKLIEGII